MPLVDGLTAVWPCVTGGAEQPDVFGGVSHLVHSSDTIGLVDDVLTLPPNTYLEPLNSIPFRLPTTSWTVAGFIRFNTQDSGHDWIGHSGNDRQWYCRYEPSGAGRASLRYSTNGTSNNEIVLNLTISLATWYFFAAWRDVAAGTINLRFRNASVVSASLTTDLYPAQHPFRVGTLVGGQAANNISVRDIAHWGRALTTAELDALAAGQQWPFPGGTTIPHVLPDEGRTNAVIATGTTRRVEARLVQDPTADNLTANIRIDGRTDYTTTLAERVRVGRYVVQRKVLSSLQFPDGTIPIHSAWSDEDVVTVDSTMVVANGSEALTGGTGADPVFMTASAGAMARPLGRGYATNGQLITSSAPVTSTDGDVFSEAVGGDVRISGDAGQGFVYPGGDLILVGQNPNGQPCFDRNRNPVFGPGADRQIEISVFGFGPEQVMPDTYGSTVKDELIAAGVAISQAYTPEFEDGADIEEAWENLEWYRTTMTERFAYWPGDLYCSWDDLFGFNVAPGENLPLLMEKPYAGEWFARWATFWDDLLGLRLRGRILVDEVNARFGNDPYDDEQQFLQHLAATGGMSAAVAHVRADGSNVPITWGIFGHSSFAAVRGYTGWTNTEFSDAIHQYHDPNAASSGLVPSLGQTLYAAQQAYMWASKHRDPSRPWWLIIALSRYDALKVDEDDFEIFRYSAPAYTLGPQMWLAIRMGATVIRCYGLERFSAAAERDDAELDTEHQFDLRPVDPGYSEWLHHCTKIHEYEQYLLGVDVPRPFPGPWWAACRRDGSAGRIWFVVNLLPRDQVLHASAVDREVEWETAEMLDGDVTETLTLNDVYGGLSVPAGGVVILTAGVADSTPRPIIPTRRQRRRRRRERE